MNKLLRVSMSGPLTVYQHGYQSYLVGLSFSVHGAKRHLHLMANLSRWMEKNAIECSELDRSATDRFLAKRCADGYGRFRTPRGLAMLLGYLRGQNAIPEQVQTITADPVVMFLERYADYLSNERGLCNSSIVGYKRVALSFLRARSSLPNGIDNSVNASDIQEFMMAECATLSVGTASNVATALRSLLNFMYLQGTISSPLADTVLRAATWRDGGQSRAVSDQQVCALLSSCDRQTKAGRRDFAILTMLSRLGLRASEVASVTLDSVEWQVGEFTFIGKGNRRERLHLPFDAGEALADYCQRARPRSACRAIFLNVRAPYNAISASSVSHVVLRASERAGIAPIRSHQLRHSVATSMRRVGVPLFEISQVLRHQHTATTAAYAKEDVEALTGIAKSWPGRPS